MIFSSFVFLGFFLPCVLVVYFGALYLTRNLRIANRILLVASLFFYAWGEPVWVLAMLLTASVDYTNGRRIGRAKTRAQAKGAVIASIVINLSILGFFKYMGFAVSIINGVIGTDFTVMALSMPIGISFYTFQSLSYVIDLYKGKAEPQKSYFNYLLYVAMFPQLVAGPIIRYIDVAHQIENRKTTVTDFGKGIQRFCIGMGKKVILANSAGAAASALLDGNLGQLSTAGAWLGILFFTFQIYFDFSGYSDMAIGMGRMFGFQYKENFRYPYISTSVTEFWRRWHISLGSFFRDYVYIPLGGNRSHQIRNILVVWFLTGLWHGASWNFIFWGMYYGFLLMIEKALMQRNLVLPKPLAWFCTILIVLYGWGIFYFTDSARLYEFSQAFFFMSPSGGLVDLKAVSYFYQNFWMFPIFIIAATPAPKWLFDRFVSGRKMTDFIQGIGILAILAVCFLLLVGQSYNPFLYFRF